MTRRKIALITAEPYESCQHRLMQGVFSQCRKYGYDAVVVAQFALACLDFEKDIEGETSIYEYVNYRRFDGVILDPLVLELAGSKKITRKLLPILRGAGVPVVCANQPIDGYPYVFVDSGLAIEKIVDHLVCAHGCERIYAVTGGKGDPVAEQRAEGFRRAMKRNGLDGGNVYHGSFTFEGGEALIGDIAGGAVPLPDAIVCASDFIALGVAKRLKDMGISIPEQVRVTGYDASPEAAVSLPSITTFVPDDAAVGAMAVRHIRELLDGRDDSGLSVNGGELVFCESCGCTMQQEYIRVKLDDILIKRSILGVEKNCSDLKSFNLSYMLEGLTGTETPEECITALGNYTYLLEPYREFRLCLRKDWLTIEDGPSKLPREMKTVLLSYSESARQEKPESRGHQSLSDKYVFEREQLLPELDEEREQPQAFFFLPVHYLDTPFGYGVLQCDITELPRPDYVITSWFRSLNNALNVTRMQYSLRQFSEYDAMTGLMNRRGLKHWLEKTLPECGGEDMLLAVSIDMDGLKYINDNFGHTEGDRGIREVAACVRQTAAKDEICVRTGGDEFLIVGVGRYRQAEVETRLDSLRVLIKETDVLTRGYTFSASIGCAAAPAQGCVPDEVFALADERMYAEKSENHKRMAR